MPTVAKPVMTVVLARTFLGELKPVSQPQEVRRMQLGDRLDEATRARLEELRRGRE